MRTLERIEQLLDLPDADKAQVLRELSAHCDEIRDELIASGMEPAKAQDEAERRLGDPEAVASKMNAVHCVAPWRSTFIAAAPFLVYGLVIARNLAHGAWEQVAIGLLVLSGMVIVAGAVRGFVRGGRPVWLPVWTASGIAAVQTGVVVASLELARRGLTIFVYLLPLTSVLYAIAATLLCWRLPRWRLALILILVFGIAMAFSLSAILLHLSASPSWTFVATQEFFWLFLKAFVVVIAVRVFAVHEYGSLIQAALFIAASRLTPILWSTNPLFTGWRGIGCAVLGMITMVLFARASSFSRKIAILGAALLAWGALITVSAKVPVALNWIDVFVVLGATYAVAFYHRTRRSSTGHRLAGDGSDIAAI